MTSKERLLKALNNEKPDRLPVTTHHLMPSFLNNYMNGISEQMFFDQFGLDPIKWAVASACTQGKSEYFDPLQSGIGFLETRRVCTENWRFTVILH